jgi:hypothetical protein
MQRGLPGYFGLLGALLLAACTAAMPSRRQSPVQEPPRSQALYVVRRGWHIDVGVPSASLPPSLGAISRELPGSSYMLFGFGDRHYLLNHDRGSSGAAAALWPGPGLILVTGLRASPAAAFGEDHVVELDVTAAGLHTALDYLERSLVREDNLLRAVAPGPYGGSAYFSARQRYSVAFTCNTWAAEMLAAAALPVHSTGVILAGQLWQQVRRLKDHAQPSWAFADTRR